MANDYFRFRRFTVNQGLCGMKVGTDGTLLGAWAGVPSLPGGRHPRILDIGTGTGLIALMMAQRYAEASVTGIDIDDGAVTQARQNVAASPFARRIAIEQRDVADMEGTFETIVCNPPYFVDALQSPDAQRTTARHAATLTYRQLMLSAWRLMDDGGELSVIIPFDCRQRLEAEAFLAGLSKVREWAVKTTPCKPPRRYLLAFRKHPAETEKAELVIGSEQYKEMMSDFYLEEKVIYYESSTDTNGHCLGRPDGKHPQGGSTDGRL